MAQMDPVSTARDALNAYEYSVEALLLLASEESTIDRALPYYEQAAFISEKNFKVSSLGFIYSIVHTLSTNGKLLKGSRALII